MTGIPGGGSDLSPKTCRSPKNFSFELKPSVSRGAEGEEGEEGAGVGEGVGGREEVLIRPGPGRPRKKVYGSLLTLNGSHIGNVDTCKTASSIQMEAVRRKVKLSVRAVII